jgi:hypothetical protein
VDEGNDEELPAEGAKDPEDGPSPGGPDEESDRSRAQSQQERDVAIGQVHWVCPIATMKDMTRSEGRTSRWQQPGTVIPATANW